jgi:putative transposase
LGLTGISFAYSSLCVKVRYRFRFYPTKEQEQKLAQVFGCCRYVYNRALRWRTDAWFERQEKVGYNQSSAELTKWKKDEATKWLNEVSSVPTQQSLRHLNNAFVRFFNKEGGYPSFKKRRHSQSAEYTNSAFKFARPDPAKPNLKLSGLGFLKVVWSRKFASKPTTVTITKEPSGRYFVSLCLEEDFSKLASTGLACGVDLGINRLATVSDGQRIGNPKHTAKNQGRLARAQRLLSRRILGSGRWNRQRVRVARIQERVADARKDALDKATTGLVRQFDRISIEDLCVHGMVRNRCLSNSISDASFGTFRKMLEYKCERYGRELRLVDRFFPSSKRCHGCGHVLESLPLAVREWVCPECESTHDRDFNAAVNLDLAGGQPVTARGGRVRRFRPSGLKRNARRSVNHLGIERALHV